MRLDLFLGADGPVREWVDGQMCHHDGRGTNPAVKDEVRVGFDAAKGEHEVLVDSYPLGRRPEQPFPYYNEVMTGFEYTATTHMLYEGQEGNGLKAIAAIRHWYDGVRRNPFDEAGYQQWVSH